jgi:hypothetical protein
VHLRRTFALLERARHGVVSIDGNLLKVCGNALAFPNTWPGNLKCAKETDEIKEISGVKGIQHKQTFAVASVTMLWKTENASKNSVDLAPPWWSQYSAVQTRTSSPISLAAPKSPTTTQQLNGVSLFTKIFSGKKIQKYLRRVSGV